MGRATIKNSDTQPTPDSGYTAIYPKTDKNLYFKDDTGSETQLGAAGVTEFADDEFRIQDNGDATKEIAFQASGITTSTTRIITMPDKDLTLDDDGDSRPPTAHASDHTDGTDDIQNATSGQKGLMTAAYASKLDGVETSADVTDATNVAAAGALMQSLADAKGDIFVATADNTVSRLAVGSNDQVLTADSGESSGVKWATPSGGTSFPQFQFFADQLQLPLSSDWAVNANAALGTDTNNSGLLVVRFDSSDEEGVGCICKIPDDATNIIIGIHSKAESAPGGVRKVGNKLYIRGFPNNSSVESWTSGTVLNDADIPTNELPQYDAQTIALSTLGVTAGEITQFELTRIDPQSGTDLEGDWDLIMLEIGFS